MSEIEYPTVGYGVAVALDEGTGSYNFAVLKESGDGLPVKLAAEGENDNIDIEIAPKGTGRVLAPKGAYFPTLVVGDDPTAPTGNRRYTFYETQTISAAGSVYRIGGVLFGTIASGSITGYYTTSLDADYLKVNAGGMTLNYFGHTLAEGWVGGRTTLQSYMFINAEGQDIGLSTSRYMVSGSMFIDASAPMGGGTGDARGNVFSQNNRSRLRNGAGYHVNSVVGTEIDVGVVSTAEALIKVGEKVVLESDDTNRGAIADYAYGLSLVTQTGSGATSQGWRIGYALGGYEAWWPFTASSRVMALVRTAPSIASGAPAYALGGGIDLRGITISEAAYASNAFMVDGSGNLGALVASGVSLQTRSAITAKTAVVNTITVIDGGLFAGAITLTCTAPTTSGTTATASVATFSIPYANEIDTRGSGYAVGDAITVSGGTFTTAASGIVTKVDGSGAVFGVKFTTPGSYSVSPGATAATTTTGSGVGLVIVPMFSILTVSVTNPGTNYSEFLPPNVTSAGATTTYRQAVLKVTMTATQGQLQLNNGKINVTGIPTSAAGLSAGDVWSNAGVLTVV